MKKYVTLWKIFELKLKVDLSSKTKREFSKLIGKLVKRENFLADLENKVPKWI